MLYLQICSRPLNISGSKSDLLCVFWHFNLTVFVDRVSQAETEPKSNREPLCINTERVCLCVGIISNIWLVKETLMD